MIGIGFIHGERKETSSWKSSQPSNHTHFANKWKAAKSQISEQIRWKQGNTSPSVVLMLSMTLTYRNQG